MENINQEFISNLNGDKKLEKKLFDYTKTELNHYLKNHYSNYNEDDVSDIIIKIFESLNRFDEKKSKYETWIKNIAKNYMIDKSRQLVNNLFFSSIDCSGTVSFTDDDTGISFTTTSENLTTNNTPYQSLETTDSLNYISSTIGTSDYSLLNMKYNSGYDYNEISKEFNQDKKKISNRVNYVKNKLKKRGG
jgi:RNA polymerase sigma-70 factor (ECF subfamily)